MFECACFLLDGVVIALLIEMHAHAVTISIYFISSLASDKLIRIRSLLFITGYEMKLPPASLALLLTVLPQNSAFSMVKPAASTADMSTASSTINDDNTLTAYQQRAGPIASSFEIKEFNPIPWLSNCHVQTIAGVLLRRVPACANVVDVGDTLLKTITNLASPAEEEATFWDRRERIDTPDGDWFHVDFKNHVAETSTGTAGQASKGLVILLHGLESNSRSTLVIDMADSYYKLGLDVCCLNFRSCSGTPNDTIGAYHLGFTDDVKHFLNIVQPDDDDNENKKPIFLSGFSLGGNVMLKTLGELKESAVDRYNIQGATVFSTPLNCEKYYGKLEEVGINRSIYTGSILKSMKQKAVEKLEQFGTDNDPTTVSALFDYNGCMEAQTIFEFEDAFICRIYGFDDPLDYYRKTACIHFMPDICVPTLVLNGVDDPFMDNANYQPTEVTYEHGGRAPVKMIHTKKGGHCGYMFHQVADGEPRQDNSWGPSELARFIEHVMTTEAGNDA